jgi:hypothetical protein
MRAEPRNALAPILPEKTFFKGIAQPPGFVL